MKNPLILTAFLILTISILIAGNPVKRCALVIVPEDFQSVVIKNQVWMAANLSVDIYRNGDAIPQAKSAEEWLKYADEKIGCWSYPEYNSSNNGFGRIYNYYAVSDPRGITPAGWHIPSEPEWMELQTSLGGADKAGKQLKSKTGWNDDSNGSNKSGFGALPAGDFGYTGSFSAIGSTAVWWSSTITDQGSVISFYLTSYDNLLGNNDTHKGNGCSIRCVKD